MTTTTTTTDSRREARLRRRLHRDGYALQKSRVRNPHGDDMGGYRIIDPSTTGIVWGVRFELDLDDVEEWLNQP